MCLQCRFLSGPLSDRSVTRGRKLKGHLSWYAWGSASEEAEPASPQPLRFHVHQRTWEEWKTALELWRTLSQLCCGVLQGRCLAFISNVHVRTRAPPPPTIYTCTKNKLNSQLTNEGLPVSQTDWCVGRNPTRINRQAVAGRRWQGPAFSSLHLALS